jgi:hypothetical protein
VRLVGVAALLLAACPGCYPGIAWPPDSSGFVYTGGKGNRQLLLFDLKARKSRVLVEDVGGPAWPAVSPDGNRFAVARKQARDRSVLLTLSVFDRKGKLLHRSKELRWYEAAKPKTSGGLPQVAWSPGGDRVLLFQKYRTALYDLKTTKLVPVKGGLVTVGGSPVRPDGKGFLTADPKEGAGQRG